MAVGTLKAILTLDTSGFSAGLKSAQSGMKEAASAAESAGKATSSVGSKVKGLLSNIGGFAAKVAGIQLVSKAMDMVKGSVDGAIRRIDTLNNADRVFQNMGFSADATGRAMTALKESINGLPTLLDAAVSSVQLLASSTKDVEKSQKIFSAVNNAVLGFGGTAQNVEGAVQQLSQAFSSGKMGAETFNSMISNKMGPALNALAESMGMTIGQLKEGMSKGTISTEQFQDALIKLNEKGGGGLVALSQIAIDSTKGISTSFANMKTAVVRGTANMITAFDKGLQKLTGNSIADILSKTGGLFEKGLTGVAGIVTKAFDGMASVFSKFKKPMTDLGAGIVILGKTFKGFFTDFAGTDFAGLRKQFTDILPESIFNTAMNFAHAINDIKEGISALIGVVTGSVTSFDDLLGVLGGVVTIDTAKSIWDLGNVFKRVFDLIKNVVQSFIGYLPTLLPVIGNIAKFVGENLVTSFNFAVKVITKVVTALTPVVKALINFGKVLIKNIVEVVDKLVIPALRSFNKGVAGNEVVIDILSAAISALVLAFAGLKVVKTVVSIFNTCKSVIMGVQKAFGLLNAVMAMNPFVLIVVAIGVVVAAFVYFWNTNDKFKAAIISAWEKIKSFFSGLGKFFGGLWDGIVNIFKSAIDLIKAPFVGIAEWFMEIFNASGLGESISTTWEGIKNIFTTVMDSIKLVFETGWNAIVAYFQSVWSVISAIFGTAWNVIYAVISVAIQLVWGVIQQYLDLIVSICTTAWNTVVEVASVAWNLLKTVIGAVLSVIFTVISTALNNIKTVFSTIWDVIKIIVTTAINVVKGIITAVMAVIRGDWQGAWNAIKGVLSTVWNGMKSVVTTVANGIKSVISNAWNGIKSVTTTVWNAIKEAMLAPIRAGKSVISGIVDSIKKLFNFRLKFPKIEIPHIPLPHFRLSGSFNPLKGQIPSIGIDWYATGGIFTGASVIGVGEAGDEAVVPLSNKARMKPFAQAISSFMNGNNDSSFNEIQVNIEPTPVILEIDGRAFAEGTVQYFSTSLDRYTARKSRRSGEI